MSKERKITTDGKIDAEKMLQMQKQKEKTTNTKPQNVQEAIKMENTTFMLGVGDCGGSVADAITAKIVEGHMPGMQTALYNTSRRGEKYIDHVENRIYVENADGSGKDPVYAKELLKKHGMKKISTMIQENPAKRTVVSHSWDGGTASSAPTVIGYLYNLEDDMDVFSCGVVPRIEEDGKAHYLALKMGEKLQKLEGRTEAIPQSISGYLVFDNNIPTGSIKDIYTQVNNEIVSSMNLFNETAFGDSGDNCIDSADFQSILSAGGRITSHLSTASFRSKDDIHNFVLDMINTSSQPKPLNPKAIGLFIKGPQDLLDSMIIDTNKITETFCGADKEPAYKPLHLEYSDEFAVGLLTAGNDMPWNKIKSMEDRYSELLLQEKDEKEMKSFDIEDPFKVNKGRDKVDSNKMFDL